MDKATAHYDAKKKRGDALTLMEAGKQISKSVKQMAEALVIRRTKQAALVYRATLNSMHSWKASVRQATSAEEARQNMDAAAVASKKRKSVDSQETARSDALKHARYAAAAKRQAANFLMSDSGKRAIEEQQAEYNAILAKAQSAAVADKIISSSGKPKGYQAASANSHSKAPSASSSSSSS